jgi:hypothetical protein
MRPTDFFPAVLVVGLLLAGCQSPPPPSSVPASLLPATTTEQKMVALRRYRTCLVNRARSIDDYKSDAMTIANAMRGSCKPEMAEMARSMAGGANTETYRQIADSADRRAVDAALNAVLTERKHRRTKR